MMNSRAEACPIWNVQTIGIVVAESQFLAQKAARLVAVEYEDMEPVLSISEAIEAKSFYEGDFSIESGNVDSAFVECEHVIEGEGSCGGQEHFYLEPQACIVIPDENNEFHMIVSTQVSFLRILIPMLPLSNPNSINDLFEIWDSQLLLISSLTTACHH